MQQAPIPPELIYSGLIPQNPTHLRPFNALASATAHAARKAKRESWSELNLRQNFADETFMRNHIKAAGLRAPVRAEPATQPRLRYLLQQAGVKAGDANDAVGTTLSGYLKLNPSLPLWAALALVLESTNRFTADACGLPQGEAV